MMIKLIQILAFSLAMVFSTLSTNAADCSKVAEDLAAGENADEILNVEVDGDDCIVKLLVPGSAGKPPRVITKTVKG